jgi:hypothetical protein
MTKRSLEIPNVSGKTVDSIMLHDDPTSGREGTIRFIDHTEVSVMVQCKQTAVVRYFDVNSNQTLFEDEETTP